MTLPDMRPGLTSREFLRIAGGYEAPALGTSPAGGLDIDDAGNLATDGDVTIGGALDALGSLSVGGDFELGANGVNRAWSSWLDVGDGVPSGGTPATGPTSWDVRSDRKIQTLDYGTASALINATFQAILPPDYDGSALKMDIFWTANSGTSGNVLWQIGANCYGDGDDASGAWGGLIAVTPAFQGQNVQHISTVTITPADASAGNMLYILLRRNGGHASDTFDGTARVQGIRIRYA